MKAIVFLLRGCPAGWLGAYGNEWVATPNLDRLAAESVVFDRHISDRPDPEAASSAMLGREEPNPPTPFPGKEGGEKESPSPRGLGAREGLLAHLRSANVRTVLVRANHPDTDGPDWFYAGWAEVFDARPQAEDNSPLDALIRSLPALLDRLTDNFLLWIEIDRLLPPWDVRQDVFDAYFEDEDEDEFPQESDEDDEEEEEIEVEGPDEEQGDDESDEEDEEDLEDDSPATDDQQQTTSDEPQPPTERIAVPPWFDPPTGPFDVDDPDAWRWLHSTFAAVVTTLDAELGAIFEQLREKNLDQTAAWFLTSDFGYPLGEHRQIGLHRPWLHEELVHLPLIVRLPAAAEACRRVSGFTQPPDIAGTLLDIFGVKPADAVSLLPLTRGEGASSRVHAITTLELNGAAESAIRTEDWAFLLPTKVPEGETREPLLFQKPDDRWEVNDMGPRNVERADELEAELKAGR